MNAPPARLAALPMYDLPELEAANDALWAAIRTRLAARGLEDAPARLSRGGALNEVWTSPNLLLAQTCGYPLMTALRGRVTLVAAPHYSAPGCEGSLHSSALVVRRASPASRLADLRGARCAVNDMTSNSGMNLLRAEIARIADGERFFSAVTVTGAHVASAAAVASGHADLAAIDSITWALLQRFDPSLTRSLRVLVRTPYCPGLPLITARSGNVGTRDALRRALSDVADDPSLRDLRAELLLCGFSALPRPHYRRVLNLQRFAAAKGYPVLC